MSKEGIPYKDVVAKPGSDLHKFLTDGNMKKAEQSYKDTMERDQKLLSKPQPLRGKTKYVAHLDDAAWYESKENKQCQKS